MKKLKMLAIDLGASSGRGIVGTFDGEKLALQENHRFTNDPTMAAGQFTWDILRIFHEIKQSIRNCALSDDKDIASIGIDTWGVDFGLLGKDGKLLANPVHYRDTRTVGVPEEAFKTFSREKLYDITGIQVMDFNSLYQLLALQRENPELLGIAKDMLFVPDLLNYFLTGKKQTEYTIASTSQLLDARTRNWSPEIIEKFGLPKHIFSNIVEPGTICGKLRDDVKEECGGIDPTVISVGAHDTASAVVAVPAKRDKFIWISSGTWSIMGTETKEPQISDKSSAYNFTNEGGYEGTIRFSKNITGLWVLQESRRQWIREGTTYGFGELVEMGKAAKPLQSFINPDDPRFGVPGNIPKRIREYCKETGQPVPETVGEIVRCIEESLALKYRLTVESIEKLNGRKTQKINVIGGGSKDAFLSQLTANACGIPVVAGPDEATSIGNLMMQAIAAGEVADLAQAREVVRNSFSLKNYEPTNDREAWDAAFAKF